MGRYLSLECILTHSLQFESSVIKVLGKEENNLTSYEKIMLEKFKLYYKGTRESENLTIEALSTQKRQRREGGTKFISLQQIPPPSNVCERAFSTSRLILTDYRKSMSPHTFECLMLLKLN